MRWAWFCVAIVLLFTSCSVATGTLHTGTDPDPAAAGDSGGLHWPPKRTASFYYENEFTGNAITWFSQGCRWDAESEPTSIIIEAGSTEPEWAYYQLSDNGFTSHSITIQLRVEAGEAWLALSDFTAGRWEILRSSSGGSEVLSLAARHFDADGRIFVAVIAAPGSLVKVDYGSIQRDEPGWNTHLVDQAGYSGRWLTMFADGPDGNANLMYRDDYKGGLMLAEATAAQPRTQADWEIEQIYGYQYMDVSADATSRPFDAQYIGDVPAFVYRSENRQDIVYCERYANDPRYWRAIPVASGAGTLRDNLTLVEFDGRPYIVLSRELVGALVAYPHLLDHTGLPWNYSQLSIVQDSKNPTSAIIDGKLTVFSFVSGALQLAVADSLEPQSHLDWDFTTICDNLDSPEPLEVLYDPVSAPGMTYLWYRNLLLYTAVADPQPADWKYVHAEMFADDADYALINGRPAAVYGSDFHRGVYLVWAKTAAPQTMSDWTVHRIAQLNDPGYVQLAEVHGAPAVAYMDAEPGSVYYATLEQ